MNEPTSTAHELDILSTQSTEGLWQKSITFDVKGEAIYTNTHARIVSILMDKVDVINKDYDIRCRIRTKLSELDLSNYYTGSNQQGPKITKVIKKILKEVLLDKALYEPHFATIARKISELYHPQTTLTTFWGKKGLIGEGVWESSSTCFSTIGCNSVSKEFVSRFRRTQVLVLASVGVVKEDILSHYENIPCSCGIEGCTKVNKESRYKTIEVKKVFYSRCLVHFLGGRRIQLTNFYYNGLPQNYRLHVEGLRRILGLQSVSFKDGESTLPIYINEDCIEVHTERSKDYTGRYKYPCPHCKEKVSRLYHDVIDNTHLIGCSEECAGVVSGVICIRCDTRVSENNVMTNENGDAYCSDCYDDVYTYCEHCSSEVLSENYDSFICHDCGVMCRSCMNYFESDNIKEVGNHSYCQECFDRTYTYCEECDKVVEQYSTTDNLCPYCYEQKVKEEKEEVEEVNI